MEIWGDFQGLSGVTGGEGRGSKNRKFEVTSFMNDPLFNFQTLLKNQVHVIVFMLYNHPNNICSRYVKTVSALVKLLS